jgi:hypothetical protein
VCRAIALARERHDRVAMPGPAVARLACSSAARPAERLGVSCLHRHSRAVVLGMPASSVRHSSRVRAVCSRLAACKPAAGSRCSHRHVRPLGL